MRPRVHVWSNRKMVTLWGEPVAVPEGAPELLSGTADNLTTPIAAVKLDDGRELLISTRDLEPEEAAPDTQRSGAA